MLRKLLKLIDESIGLCRSAKSMHKECLRVEIKKISSSPCKLPLDFLLHMFHRQELRCVEERCDYCREKRKRERESNNNVTK